MSRLDPKQVTAAMSKLVSASIGDIAVILSRSPGHKFFSLADIEWMVLPPVLAGQYYVAEAQDETTGARAPVACVTWAKVSDDVDQRLTTHAGQPIRLRPEEWTGGEHHWLIDLVGEPRAVGAALSMLEKGPFKGQRITVVTRDPTGAAKLQTLHALLAVSEQREVP